MTNPQNVLLIGKIGAGKSTLANVLTNSNEFTKNNQKGEFYYHGIYYRIITIAVEENSNAEMLTKLLPILEGGERQEKLRRIFWVTEGTFTESEIRFYHLLKKFAYSWEISANKFTTIIRTKFPDFPNPEKCQEDIKRMVDENKEVAEIVKKCSGVVHVDNLNEAQVEIRKILLNHLEKQKICYQFGSKNNILKQLIDNLAIINNLQQETKELETKLTDSETTLTNVRQQLDQLKSELTKKEQEHQKLTDKLNTEQTKSADLEEQLTTLAISSGLLTQQVENLNKQLSESEQKEERVRLEGEIRANLLRERGDKISQQGEQIDNYQQLLRSSEENLKKVQEIITERGEQLEKLGREKENIQTELDLATEKIKVLENSLLSSNGKIRDLEVRIRELESGSDSSLEIERLKKELSEEKTKSQAEINRLKTELAKSKQQAEELAEKIKKMGKSKEKIVEVVAEKSFWTTIKTPLFYTLGIILVMMFLGWIWSDK